MANDILNEKEAAIVSVAAYTARGNQADLKKALIAGFDKGLTVNELKEILVQAYAYCGFPRSLNALNTLMQLEEERGNKDAQGKLSSVRPKGNSLENGTKNQTQLVGRPESLRPLRCCLLWTALTVNCKAISILENIMG